MPYDLQAFLHVLQMLTWLLIVFGWDGFIMTSKGGIEARANLQHVLMMSSENREHGALINIHPPLADVTPHQFKWD